MGKHNYKQETLTGVKNIKQQKLELVVENFR